MISKIAKFDLEIWSENLATRSLQILYIFVLRARVSTTFSWNVGLFPRVVQKYTKFANTPPPPPKKKSRLIYHSQGKTPQSSLKILGFALYFQLLSVFENRRKSSSYSCLNYYFEGISADKMLSLQYNRIKQFFVC